MTDVIHKANLKTRMISKHTQLTLATVLRSGRSTSAMATMQRLQPLVAAVVVLLALWSIWAVLQTGLSRFHAASGVTNGSLESTERAVALNPSDPEAHYANAVARQTQGKPLEAIESLKQAAALRPQDYFLWLELGRARSAVDDRQGARVALETAMKLAPSHAQAGWQLGNLLLREGKKEEAFYELRRAARRDQTLLLPLIDFAWNTYNGEAKAVERAVKPHNSSAQLALASYFVKHNLVAEGIDIYHVAADGAAAKSQSDFINALIEMKRIDEAMELMSAPQIPERSRQTLITAMLSAGYLAEAAHFASRIKAPERVRRNVLNKLLEAKMFDEALTLLRDTNASERERRTVLTALLAANQLDEAFELNKTVGGTDRGRRTVLKELIEAKKFEQAIGMVRTEGVPEQDRQAVIRALMESDMAMEAVELMRVTGGVSEQQRRNMLKPLIAQKHYAEAFQVWSLGRAATGIGEITDGGFEDPIMADDMGFGWQVSPKMQAVHASVDAQEPHGGKQSLQIEFTGNSKYKDPILSQLVAVNPNTRYQLNFAARARNIVGTCPPVIAILAPDSDTVMARFASLPQGTSGWTQHNIAFTTPGKAGAVRVVMWREAGATAMCPVFGTLWLDGFSLRKA